jgi:phage major head subunit gpT-like protein
MGQPAQYPTLADPAVIGIILQSLENQPKAAWVTALANFYDSNQATETYAAAGNVAPMREWIGEKQIKDLRTYNLTISNKDWESTLRLFERDIRRDKIAQLEAKAGQLSQRAVQHEEKLLSQLIDTGDDADLGTAYDGQ